MTYTCHWPGCKKEVLPALWGCPPHWYTLPKELRDRIWATYRAGQEIAKTPSLAYLEAAQEVRLWCLQHDLNKIAPTLLKKQGDRLYATEDGCRKLEAWFAERGIAMTVKPDEGRFDVQSLETPVADGYDTGPLHGVAHYMRRRANGLARHNTERRTFESYAVVCDAGALHIAKLERQLKTHDEVIAQLQRQVEEMSASLEGERSNG